jgi:hypothetical protein
MHSSGKNGESYYRLHFVPTRYEAPPGRLWFLDGPEFQRVISEYVKIAWFALYSTTAVAHEKSR